jgi:hypothetical protein
VDGVGGSERVGACELSGVLRAGCERSPDLGIGQAPGDRGVASVPELSRELVPVSSASSFTKALASK